MIKDEVIEMLEGLQRSGVKISGFENLLKNSGKGFRLEPMSKPDDKEVSEEEERKWTFF